MTGNKMKKDIHIGEPELRRLLKLYYEGETSREEEREIARFFADGANDIPEDLADDAGLFKALYGSDAGQDQLYDAILRRLDCIDSEPAAKIRKGRAPLFRIAVSVAASLALVMVFAHFMLFRSGPTSMTDETAIMADLHADSVVKNNDVANNTVIKSAAAVAQESPKAENKPVRMLAAAQTKQSHDTEPDHFRELTDPEEAAAVIEMALGKLNDHVKYSNKIIEKTNSNFSTVYQTINNLEL